MADLSAPVVSPKSATRDRLNVADRLAVFAAERPGAIAIACPRHAQGGSREAYSTITFAGLDADATQLARGLVAWGVKPGTRLALLVRPGIEFVTLVFALLRAGVVIVLVDPGMGRKNLIRCLSEAEPEGFVAVSAAQAVRSLLRQKFTRAKLNVTVGRRWFWGGLTLNKLRAMGATGSASDLPKLAPTEQAAYTEADDPAAIIFTSGSTGPPKGVLYTHRMFDTQTAEIQAAYGIQPGGVDLACFPLFALFNSAMGVTTVFPQMNFSRPASADPRKLLTAANDWQVTQAFASPAVWRVLGEHCAKSGERIASLRQVFSCGAPVGADVLRQTLAFVADGAKMHTPYGATECLPVATIEAAEVQSETAAKTNQGAGVCVGRPFETIEWRLIRITDKPISSISNAEELPAGEIGELIVRGPQASPEYVTRAETNAEAKIADGEDFWHRMGDVGYLDEQGRFWYCGRKSQRVETAKGTLFTECVEAIVNTHPAVWRSALVGVGPRHEQRPVLVVERQQGWIGGDVTKELARTCQSHPITEPLHRVLVYPRLPVDVRHNAKINREKLAEWAAKQI